MAVEACPLVSLRCLLWAASRVALSLELSSCARRRNLSRMAALPISSELPRAAIIFPSVLLLALRISAAVQFFLASSKTRRRSSGLEKSPQSSKANNYRQTTLSAFSRQPSGSLVIDSHAWIMKLGASVELWLNSFSLKSSVTRN